MKRASPLNFLVDESVPDAVVRILRESGHNAEALRDSGLARGTPDQLVCAYAEANDHILVALDHDMKTILRNRFKSLSLIKLSCGDVNAARRISEAVSLIEHEWQVDQGARCRRIFIDVKKESLTVYR
ncbi:DUF5615 family PIN-like protein [Asticcacaulis biprosthecium]|uniref:DUF5615 family PIN-like protein n=1 Tax=Asticcacaulis biprosthecium TaxID=76891 RepID=UPI0035ABDBA4